jgi:DNA-binding CsgD family transcriptional regulator
LLSQANAYEQSLSGQPIAHMAVSVLATLARQLLQHMRDLEADLHPHTLETLGLAPALELLAGQFMRATSVHIRLTLDHLPARLPIPSELAIFRLTQVALTRAIRSAHATQITIRLEQRTAQICLSMRDNGLGDENRAFLQNACQRIEQLGGAIEMGIHSDGGFELMLLFPIMITPTLTARELEVLLLLVEGLSNKQIAKRLIISPRTVNFHLDHIYSKLGVNTRTEASIAAMRLGWVPNQ